MGHSTAECRLAAKTIKCWLCGGDHHGEEHGKFCRGAHTTPGVCSCTFKCILCGKTSHHACSKDCPTRGHFPAPLLETPHPIGKTPSILPKPSTTPAKAPSKAAPKPSPAKPVPTQRVDDEPTASVPRSASPSVPNVHPDTEETRAMREAKEKSKELPSDLNGALPNPFDLAVPFDWADTEMWESFHHYFHPVNCNIFRPRLRAMHPFWSPSIPFQFKDVFHCACEASAYTESHSFWPQEQKFVHWSIRHDCPSLSMSTGPSVSFFTFVLSLRPLASLVFALIFGVLANFIQSASGDGRTARARASHSPMD